MKIEHDDETWCWIIMMVMMMMEYNDRMKYEDDNDDIL
jgi:hypothetical protein